jgi:hypothetical protein
MHPPIHHCQDSLELEEVLALRRYQWMCIEKRDDHIAKVVPPVNIEAEQVFLVIVMSAISVDASAVKELK